MTATVGVPRETFPGERRVALTPKACDALIKAKFQVIVEHAAGLDAGFPDEEYARRGVRLGTRAEVFAAADVIAQARAGGSNPGLSRNDLALMRPGQMLIAFGDPLTSPRDCVSLAEAGVSFFAMELVPRITRARRRPAGDCDRAASGCGGFGVRRASGSERTD